MELIDAHSYGQMISSPFRYRCFSISLTIKNPIMTKYLILCISFFFLQVNLLSQECGCTLGTNQLNNPDFSNGNTGFQSDYILDVPEGCAHGAYVIGNQPTVKCTHVEWIEDLWDYTLQNSQGSYMIIDGAQSSTISAPNKVWIQSVQVVEGVTYNFSFFLSPSVTTDPNENLRLNVLLNDQSISNTINPNEGNEWEQHCFEWVASVSGSVEISIQQVGQFAKDGYDYGIDDVFFGTCCGITSAFDYQYGDSSCNTRFTNNSTSDNFTEILGYQWNFGEGHTSNEESPTHQFPGPGDYNVCLTVLGINQNGDCCTKTVCQEVTVSCITDPCMLKISEILAWTGEFGSCEYNLTVNYLSNKPVVGHHWDFGDGHTAIGGQDIVHNFPLGQNTYNVCVTVYAIDGDECCSRTLCQDVRVNCGPSFPGPRKATNSSGKKASLLKIHPNPATQDVSVQFSSKKNKSYELGVFDTQGKQLLKQSGICSENKTDVNINDNQLSPGIYFIKVVSDGLTRSEKLIIQ